MKSRITDDFRKCFSRLPPKIQRAAANAYRRSKDNPQHPGLQFKKIHADEPIYSVRVAIGWRVLGLLEDDTIVWFWIGSHAEYDRIISQL